MSLYIGKKANGDPLLHFTNQAVSQSEISGDPISSTTFHSDLEYLQVFESVLVDTWASSRTEGNSRVYAPVIPGRIRELINQGYLFSIINRSNSYLDTLPRRNPLGLVVGDTGYGMSNFFTQGTTVQSSRVELILQHSSTNGSPFNFPFSQVAPFDVISPDGGNPRRDGSLYVHAEDARPSHFTARGSSSFTSGSTAFNVNDVLQSSNSFRPSQSASTTIASRVHITEADAGNNRARNTLIPDWRVPNNQGLSLPSRLYYEEIGQGRNPANTYRTRRTPPGYLFVFYNVRSTNNSYNILRSNAQGIEINNQDIRIGTNFSLRNSELVTTIAPSAATGRFNARGQFGYTMDPRRASELADDGLFQFLNNLYYRGRVWTPALASLAHNAQITVWVDANNRIKTWQHQLSPEAVALWTIKPNAILNTPTLQLTNDTLRYIDLDTSRTVDIVTAKDGLIRGLLKLTGRELNITVPTSRFTYADARSGATFVAGRFARPYDSTGDAVGAYRKTEVVARVNLPADVTSDTNIIHLMLQPTTPEGRFSVTRGGNTVRVDLQFDNVGNPAPLFSIGRPTENRFSQVGSNLFQCRFTATNITTQRFTNASNSGNNRMQGVAVRYYLQMDWATQSLEVVREFLSANPNWTYRVIRGDGNVHGRTSGYGTRDVVYQVPPIRINAYVTSADTYG